MGGQAPLWGHGIGGRADLPVPLELFLVGGGLVLVVSFVALTVLWPKPRLQGGLRPTVGRGAAPLFGLVRGVGVGALALVVATGLLGVDNATRNPASVLVWVVFWLVLPFAGALVGDLYTAANPWRSLAEWVGVGPHERGDLLARLGVWPATAALVAFTWLELVWPTSGNPRTVAVAALAYTAYLLGAMAFSGREAGLQMGDAFTTYNRLLSSIAPLGRDPQGRLVWRGWLRALPLLPEWRGLTAFVVVMIGTVTFDGLSFTPWWRETFGPAADTMAGGTAGLRGTVALIGAGYRLACWAAARLGGGEWTAGTVATRFAHTLVPIALAYAFAHYFSLIVLEGQYLLSALSDPFGSGWDLFGTRDRLIDFTLLTPTAIWYVQVAAIVGGHVLAVVLAHDRALHDFPPALAVRSQYAMLALMVALTGLGLTILSVG